MTDPVAALRAALDGAPFRVEIHADDARALLRMVEEHDPSTYPPHDLETGCMSHSCLVAQRTGGVGCNGSCTCLDFIPWRDRAKARIIGHALQLGKRVRYELAEMRRKHAQE